MVIVEKPFISKKLSKREKNEKFFKKSLIFTLTHEQSRGLPRRRISDPNKSLNETIDDKAEKHDEIKKFESKDMKINYDLISNFDSFGCGFGSSSERRQSSIDSTELAKIKPATSQLESNENISKDENESKKRAERPADESVNEVNEKKRMKLSETAFEDTDNEDLSLVIDADVVKDETPKKINDNDSPASPKDASVNDQSEDMGPASPSNEIAEPDEVVAGINVQMKVIPLDKEPKKLSETKEQQKQPTTTTSTNKGFFFLIKIF